ncbi:efflux RND transporter periplasmic adaptor subunit [Chitinophaga sp. SYP-B3965]|uniref:efflux RND transporter periplasmic adaptor subunit n=1 Tax=Chitinophaga sp. SYP-B3965 TaxID=2663120 RepID=UPI001299FD94|nr:efflux RND transporter periplasmic adaptor subunit [Chitinophaga sp. SYP-B3965]MRG47492.1 efflux RND transporter periplasmic adaptor subunit [Chitinophaga sp. SYP-B3965]
MYLPRSIYTLPMCLLLCACGGKQKPAQGPMPRPTVSTFEVKPATYVVTENFPATLTAHSIVEIRSDVTGFLETIRAQDGSVVSKGQVLYEVDRSRSMASYDQAKASVAQAEADLAQKQRDLERYSNLLKQDAIAKQTVEQASTLVETAKANLAAAKAAQTRSGTDINHAVIRAPVSGKIGIALVRVGDLVSAGQTTINTLVNENPIYADIDLPQNRYAEFRKGNLQRYYIMQDNGEVYPEEGKVLLINNIIDPQTGTIRVRLTFPNKQEALKSGMSAVVQVKYNTADTALAIPSKAIVELLGEVKAYVVDEHNVVQQRPITRGPIIDSMLVIRSGIRAGDRIVVEGIQKVKQGDTVNIK